MVVRGKPFQRLPVKLSIAVDAFFDHQFARPGGEWCGIDPDHDGGVAFEQALSAIPGKSRISRRPHEAADRGRRAADVEHGIEHAGHGLCGSRSHRHQQWTATVAELLPGHAFQEGDAFPQPVGQVTLRVRVAGDDRGTELDGQNKRRRHRQSERGHAREIGGLPPDRLGGNLVRRPISYAHDLHWSAFSLTLKGRQERAGEANARNSPAGRSRVRLRAQARAPRVTPAR
jgi:hypothetical protein